MCESVPASPLPFLFFVEVRGEPGKEASYNLVKTLLQPADSFNSRVSGNLVTTLSTWLLPYCKDHVDNRATSLVQFLEIFLQIIACFSSYPFETWLDICFFFS